MPNIHHWKWLTSNIDPRRRTIQPGPPPKPARQYLNQVIFWQKLSEFKVGKPFFPSWNIFTILYDEQAFSQSVANLSERSGVEVDSHNNAITRSSSRFVSSNGKVWSLIQSSNEMVFSDNSLSADNSLYVMLWSKLTCCAGSPLWCDGLTEGRTGPCIHHQPYHKSWCFNFYKVNHVNLFPIISILMM